jgi:hypothetical protein
MHFPQYFLFFSFLFITSQAISPLFAQSPLDLTIHSHTTVPPLSTSIPPYDLSPGQSSQSDSAWNSPILPHPTLLFYSYPSCELYSHWRLHQTVSSLLYYPTICPTKAHVLPLVLLPCLGRSPSQPTLSSATLIPTLSPATLTSPTP